MPVHHQDEAFQVGGSSPGKEDKASKYFQVDGHVRDCMIWNSTTKRPDLYRYVREIDPGTGREFVTRQPYVPRPFNRAPELGKPRVYVPDDERTPINYKSRQWEGGVADSMIWWPSQSRFIKASEWSNAMAEDKKRLAAENGGHGSAKGPEHSTPAGGNAVYTSPSGYTYVTPAAPAPAHAPEASKEGCKICEEQCKICQAKKQAGHGGHPSPAPSAHGPAVHFNTDHTAPAAAGHQGFENKYFKNGGDHHADSHAEHHAEHHAPNGNHETHDVNNNVNSGEHQPSSFGSTGKRRDFRYDENPPRAEVKLNEHGIPYAAHEGPRAGTTTYTAPQPHSDVKTELDGKGGTKTTTTYQTYRDVGPPKVITTRHGYMGNMGNNRVLTGFYGN